jgi:molybdopterin-guanine dinucleotide biosynthesis protein A
MLAAVILAGGAARRVGGATKPALQVGGEALLNRVLASVALARPRIVVGPDELTGLLPADVTLTREDPPGGGPVAAIAAGVSCLDPATPHLLVAVLAGDLPFLSGRTVDSLRDGLLGSNPVDGAAAVHGAAPAEGAAPVDGAMPVESAVPADGAVAVHAAASLETAVPADGAVLVDRAGRPQWLAGVWRLDSLVDRLAALGDPSGRAVRDLVSGLRVARVRVADLAGPPPWFDCDTEDDLRRAEEWARADIG